MPHISLDSRVKHEPLVFLSKLGGDCIDHALRHVARVPRGVMHGQQTPRLVSIPPRFFVLANACRASHASHACLPACCGEKVSLGFITDVSQPARHHDIEQMYRQRTRQYKVELRKLEAIAAKERERLLAEERAHARRQAALGDKAGGADDKACVFSAPGVLGRATLSSLNTKASRGIDIFASKQYFQGALGWRVVHRIMVFPMRTLA